MKGVHGATRETFPQVTNLISEADDGIRTPDPHLGNFEANVSYVAMNLSSASELRVFVSPVSSVS